MKIHLLNLLGVILLCSVVTNQDLRAQDVTFTPEYYKLEIVDEDTKKHGFEMTNNTQGTLDWYWNIELADDFPPEWEVQVCDLNLCYGWGVEASADALPNEQPAGATTNPDLQYVNVRSNGVAGISSAVFCVYGDAARTQEIFCTSLTSSTNELGEIVNHTLYPNPVVDGFQIANDELVESISITTVTGERLMNQAHRSGDSVDTSELPAGSYIVTMYNKDNQTTGIQRFVKSAGN
jgi:hypothetical protein